MTTKYKSIISEEDILKQIHGKDKTGYTLKNIPYISENSIAELTGISKLSLSIKKAGNFEITLVLEHPIYKDTTIFGADFEIKKLPKKTLTFDKLTRSIQDGDINTVTILKSIKGDKKDYTLESITLADSTIADVIGKKPTLSLRPKK